MVYIDALNIRCPSELTRQRFHKFPNMNAIVWIHHNISTHEIDIILYIEGRDLIC